MIITNTNSLQVFNAILRTDNIYTAGQLTISLIAEGQSTAVEITPTSLDYESNYVKVSYSITSGELIDGKTYLLTLKDSSGKLLFRDKLQVKDEYTLANADERFNLHDTDFVYLDTNPDGSSFVYSDIGAGEGDKNYLHDQGVVSAVWTISHGLGKYPSVSVVDTANQIVFGEIEYVDTNNIIITFNAAFSGSAYLN
mgnify:FL=1